MDTLRASWRMQYITDSGTQDEADCIFCDYPRADNDRENLLLYRGKCCYVLLNRYPYSPGHLMVIPYRHLADLLLLTPEENQEMLNMAQKAVTALNSCMNPNGYNLGLNLGKVAGAGIDKHLHMHVVPRWNGDTNFMTVIGETRVLPEALEQTYDKVLSAWGKGCR